MSIAVRASRLRVHFGIDLLSALTEPGAVPDVGYVPSELRTSHVSARLREKGMYRSGVERARAAQRPQEGPAPLGQT